jgi:hypothetical protein
VQMAVGNGQNVASATLNSGDGNASGRAALNRPSGKWT